MKLIKKDKKGFTLVELIVVIAILAILALILIPAITGYITKADRSSMESSARSAYSEAASLHAAQELTGLSDLKQPADKYTMTFDFEDANNEEYKITIYKGASDSTEEKVEIDQDGVITRYWEE